MNAVFKACIIIFLLSDIALAQRLGFPSEVDLCRGGLAGASCSQISGLNSDVDTTTDPEDVWDGGGTYTGFPAASETLSIASSDANDIAAGTGARAVTVTGLGPAYLTQEEVLTMNGTSSVVSPSTWLRVNKVKVSSVGSGGTNAGTLTLNHTTTTANVFAVIPPGVNGSRVACQTIPANKTGILKRINLSADAGTTNLGAVWVRESGKPFSLVQSVHFDAGRPHEVDIYGGIVLPQKTDFCVRALTVGTDNTAVSAGADLVLIDN